MSTPLTCSSSFVLPIPKLSLSKFPPFYFYRFPSRHPIQLRASAVTLDLPVMLTLMFSLFLVDFVFLIIEFDYFMIYDYRYSVFTGIWVDLDYYSLCLIDFSSRYMNSSVFDFHNIAKPKRTEEYLYN